jgi:uncharacterized circularly permuted ATP-grasp superfamily protein/uncharacterized alpha-E superfamily protein
LERLGWEELSAREEDGRRLLAEHGVSCFVQTAEGGVDEPWQLDPLPLLIDGQEWVGIEQGLKQRACLLDRVLADLYGTQRLVRDGLVPAALVFANPGYLRACQALEVRGGVYLQSYAADLARSADGRWWVMADRTQAPGGLGFALENRTVVSRMLPEAILEIQPRQILEILRVQRDTLRHFAPGGVEKPAVVLLTPGPRNEAYFEHAYLARLLGLTLVEGDDLTVRDRRLFIKTLEGLRAADVVLRRVGDAFCDPLELRGDSLLGVPGLVEAARSGHVALGNALGAGLLEGPAFLPFLPSLCRHLLAEELKLPSVATWWCGQGREQTYVRERLNELIVRPAFQLPGRSRDPLSMDATQRAELLDEILSHPHELVGQEQVRLSHAPCWTPQGLESKPFILRVFVLHDGTDYVVMPGGLARMVPDTRLATSALPLNLPSKDVWVLPVAGAEDEGVTVTAPASALSPERGSSDLPSRTADNFFWVGRYAERLEQLTRVCRYVLRCVADDAGTASQRRLGPLELMLERMGLLSEANPGTPPRERLQQRILPLLFEEESPKGTRRLLKRIHLAAFSLRDRVSTDTWRILTRLDQDARQLPGRTPLAQALSLSDRLVVDLAALSGMEMENMTRGHGWVFLDFGRRLERGSFISGLLAAMLRASHDVEFLLEPALEIFDSVMTHRRWYFSEPRLASTIHVLAWESSNPRSLAFQIAALERHSGSLPSGANPEGVALARSFMKDLSQQLRELSQRAGGLPELEQARELSVLGERLHELSELLTQMYFSHVTPQVN